MAKNKIVINGDVYTDSDIISGNAFLSNSLACDELTVDTLSASMNSSKLMGTLFVPDGSSSLVTSDQKTLYVMPKIRIRVTNPEGYEYGMVAYYYHNDILTGKFYVAEVERTGKYVYEVSCVSAIGLLDTSTHYGGMYTGQTMETVLAEIIGGLVPYSISNNLKNQTVFNWLPIDSRRKNFQQLLFVMGASVFKDRNGDMYIAALNADDPVELDVGRIYLEGSVSAEKKVKRVIVMEHSFSAYASDAETVLYDGVVAAESIVTPSGSTKQGVLVRFDGPMHDLSIEGGTILESNVNYAVIGPSPTCKLVGKAYTHTTRQVIRENNAARVRSVSVQIQDNDAVVENATLVSVANSENVADRVMSYYSSSKTVKAGIVKQHTDKPGMRVAFDDTFGDPVTGYIKSMDITMSGILKAESEVVVGYLPTAIGNNYSQVIVLSSDQTWTSPVSGRILAVLVGGGDGGASGAPGDFGSSEPGTGGEGGKAGNGGKISILNLTITKGQQFSTKIGAGGKGGKSDGLSSVAGSAGGATTFGAHSSADGLVSDLGYKELFGGLYYGEPGVDGKPGRPGRKLGDPRQTEPYGPGNSFDGNDGENKYNPGTAYGGSGGGAAWWDYTEYEENGDGESGQSAIKSVDSSGTVSLDGGRGGNGGKGGNALRLFVLPSDPHERPIPPDIEPTHMGSGRGGFGGHGGGGGGTGGKVEGDTGGFSGAAGQGGPGGNGGDGFAGCVILYLP